MSQGLKDAYYLLLIKLTFSGGGSALLPAPIPPISLDELGQLTKLMSLHGATINEMNIIRKHVELLKGGGLAKVASPAKVGRKCLKLVLN